ncbi:hypothetical protein FB45DRAFT_843455 [Roridomyces roridus]|uniref:BTB domain-containing protein n=1 Tax=Roridomyces roridus TaxID=1738132 RepID=A0AAD7FCL5_9AGAR|nr:hypothetical protein FB45DRAFT_843455 [Roridomyces roridus]
MDIDHQPHRIPELWFEDGNIVIQAGNSQFRVHRGILAACSPVFQDMLTFPQPPESELLEGCPLVRMPDHPNEVAVFLKAIFKPDYFRPFPGDTEYFIVQGCLRLGHKYGVEHLRLRALVHLSSSYRTTMTEWDMAGEGEPAEQALSMMISWGNPAESTFRISAIQLAREVDALWILPMAFYDLALYPMEATVASLMHGASFNGVPISLSVQDQANFFVGHAKQIHASSIDILKFLSTPLDESGCISPADCCTMRLRAVESLRQNMQEYPAMPLDVWGEGDWEVLDDICSVCLASLKSAHRAARQAFWDRMPEMYNLPPREELERMKVAALGAHWWRS